MIQSGVLFDPEPSEFSPQWLEWLDQFVREHAGGILYMAGPKNAVAASASGASDAARLSAVMQRAGS